MRKLFASVICFVFFAQLASAQENLIRPKALGVSFILNDFATAQRIRSGSLTQVLRDDKFAKFKEMSPGVALTYFEGLHQFIDFAGSLAVSFPSISLPGKTTSSGDAMLLEADASVNLKLLPENYWFTPYAIAGVGGSKYKNYYGAFVPLGIGLKVNLFDEAAFFVSSQYRVPVTTETANYHFVNSIGIAGVIGNKKQPELKQAQ